MSFGFIPILPTKPQLLPRLTTGQANSPHYFALYLPRFSVTRLTFFSGIRSINERRARFTLSESGKYACTSGSSKTVSSFGTNSRTSTVPSAFNTRMEYPFFRDLAYFPRRPFFPVRSYSGSISSSWGLIVFFFISFSFGVRRLPAKQYYQLMPICLFIIFIIFGSDLLKSSTNCLCLS